ncbi:MAG: helix-turn-helix transcriptional regulator [Myxococcales bacterium]|nr:helix-turn-helix transcriptional regulator [Myxococcales bacterium]
MTSKAPNDVPLSTGLSRRFRLARERRGLTLRALAAASGCQYSTIVAIESAGRMPQITTIEILARSLGVSPGWLAYGEGAALEGWRDDSRANS